MRIGLFRITQPRSKVFGLERIDKILNDCSDIHLNCENCPDMQACQENYDARIERVANKFKYSRLTNFP